MGMKGSGSSLMGAIWPVPPPKPPEPEALLLLERMQDSRTSLKVAQHEAPRRCAMALPGPALASPCACHDSNLTLLTLGALHRSLERG